MTVTPAQLPIGWETLQEAPAEWPSSIAWPFSKPRLTGRGFHCIVHQGVEAAMQRRSREMWSGRIHAGIAAMCTGLLVHYVSCLLRMSLLGIFRRRPPEKVLKPCLE